MDTVFAIWHYARTDNRLICICIAVFNGPRAINLNGEMTFEKVCLARTLSPPSLQRSALPGSGSKVEPGRFFMVTIYFFCKERSTYFSAVRVTTCRLGLNRER